MINLSAKELRHINNLKKKASYRKEEGIFIVEGIKMYREIPKDLLVKTYISKSFEEALAERGKTELGSYEVISDRNFESISDTKTPQGILALVRCLSYSLEDMLGKNKKSLLILENIQDPGNLGTMLRVGEAAGLSGLIMSEDTVDIYNPKVVRSTMGSIFRLPFICAGDLKALVKELKERNIKVYASTLENSSSYDSFDYTLDHAFIMGNESGGVSEDLCSLADDSLHIPMQGRTESLNVSVAAAILLYEAARQRGLGGFGGRQK